ncbi:RHS repeat-associated core domain-containing protein [Micromonospora sp. NBC_01796]|uniref:RHS repeat-associated core domain-containing protein n=1 Tax=Micromonospora sp. NBC_01796 TaxID=2975987 RepID=UPI002DDB751B|nr:RHS repeat-associated core domain-containing protein [Micromonospora sp. NBC_01796]WSA86100.1 polymorphic toxin-type HINT domain-containing protein [Micromonospora sp. NBC_01796]
MTPGRFMLPTPARRPLFTGARRRVFTARSRLVRRLSPLLALVMLLSVLTPVRAQAAPATVDLPELQQEPSVPMRVVPARAVVRKATAPVKPKPVIWPDAATATAAVPAGGTARVGDTPVKVGTPARATGRAATAAAGPARVRVEVQDRPRTERAAVRGLLFALRSDDGRAGRVSVEVDYSGFKEAYGADWSSRLRLVQLPECALTTPELAECQQRTVLPTRNDQKLAAASAEIDLTTSANARAAAPSALVALAAGSAGTGGSYAATSLAPSGSWSAGSSSGDFSWSYPMELPPSAGGPAPQIGLGYSSGSIDGRMVATNNQPSWIGDGWDYSPGFVERRYKACAEDMGSGANNTVKTGDQCWVSENITLSLNGRNSELVRDDATGSWRMSEDDGSRVERLTGAVNGDDNGEYWRVTTTDGTQYYFGRNRLPNWATGNPETRSTWTVPIFGNHAGEPCHTSTFDTSSCQQGWRWNLDHVVDPHANSMAYYYVPEDNYYGRNIKTTGVQYERGGYLDRIEYGLRSGTEYSKPALSRVVFNVAERCLPDANFDCADSKFTQANASRWPDVPIDQNCKAGEACTDRFSPTFWTRKRLTAITTQVRSGASYQDVNTWSFTHQFPPTGDGTAQALWLSGITRTGKVGGELSTPAVTFVGTLMQNRVDRNEGVPAITRYRIVEINTETGSTIGIDYSSRECSGWPTVVVPSQTHNNTMRCYPIYWQPEGETQPKLDWFHKYVATRVVEQDRSSNAPQVPKETRYDYVGDPAWGYDDSEFTKAEHRTWSQWRGYARVRTRVGAAPFPVSMTETLFFRGLHGDKQPTGSRSVQVVDSEGGSIDDISDYQGMSRETLYYSGDAGTLQSATLNTPWRSASTATRARAGTTPLVAYVTQMASVRSRSLLSDGTWRRTEVQHTFDAYGIPTQTSDLGDLARNDDNSCTRHEYARNTTAWILTTVKRIEKVAVACATTPARPADLVSDTRMYYDGSTTHGTAPTKGDVTQVEELMEWPAGGPRYKVTSKSVFDAYGRVTEAYDVYGNKSTTAYTPATDALVSQVTTTNPKGHQNTTYMEPAWGVNTATVDPNGARTDLAYDPMGRLVSVWLPGRAKADFPTTPNSRFTYRVVRNAPVVVTTETLKEDGSYRTGYEIYDGTMRLRQTQQPASGGGRILTDTFYDTRGLAWKKNGAYHNDAAPSATLADYVGDQFIPSQSVTQYDGMGRPTNEIFNSFGVEKWKTVTSYGGDRVFVDPPTGGTPTTTITDALGRATELRQHKGTTPTGAYDATTYSYDRFGRLSQVKDPAGNTWGYGFDLRGRMVSSSDPDRGTATTRYDDGGRVVSTTNARNDTIASTYDELGRPTTMRYGSETGTIAASFTYDTLKLGLPTSSTRHVGTNAYVSEVTGYNFRYQPTGTKITVPASEGALAGTYSFGASYTATTGLPKTNTYPSGGGLPSEVVTYGYDGLDMPVSVTGLSRYLQSTAYSEYGEPLRQTLGAINKEVFLTYKYEDGSRRLKQVTTDRITAPTRLDDVTYRYDAAGNVLQIKNVEQNTTTDNQCFSYDYLRRMTNAWTGTDDCVAAPSSATVGGPNPYWHSYTFDAVGNRLSETQHDTTGNPANNVTSNYTYPAAGAAQPHTLQSVTTTGPPTGGLPGGQRLDEYDYDATGNTTSRKIGGNEQVLEWNAEGRLGKVTEGTKVTEYLYDASGSRLIRRDPTTVTLYLGSTEMTLNKATSAVTGTRYYSGVGAVRTGTQVSFLLADHHGTAQASVNASTLALTRRKFTPYGQARGTQPSVWPGQKGFVGGTIDASTGLTSLGAREYDAATGRFISVDPIIDFKEPQQMHGYAYSNNSPVTYTDPTGLRMCVDEDCEVTYNPVTKKTSGTDRNKTPSDGAKAPSGPSRQDVDKAKKVKEKKILDIVIEAGGQILLEVLGINDIRDCVMKGDIGACAMAVVGSLPWGKIFKAKKIGEAMVRAGKAVMNWFSEMKWAQRVLAKADEAAAAAARQTDEVAEAAATQADEAGATAARQGDDAAGAGDSCPIGNSFTPGTQVVMADGSSRPIEDVELGDEVLATDPESGVTEARPVVALIVGEGYKDLVEVTVDTDGNAGDSSGTVIATDGHPFWVESVDDWVVAAELQPGQWLRTPAGTSVQVDSVSHFVQQRRVHNLSIGAVHTYYVAVGSTPVLVHNCGPEPGEAPAGSTIEEYAEANRGINQASTPDFVTEYTSPSGRRYYGRTQGNTQIAPGSALDDVLGPTHRRTCSEVCAMNEAQKAEGDLAIIGGFFRTLRVRPQGSPMASGVPFKPCEDSCLTLIRKTFGTSSP